MSIKSIRVVRDYYKKVKGDLLHLTRLLKWLWLADTIDTLDSPMLYNFVRAVIWQSPTSDSKTASIEKRRHQLLQSTSSITTTDLGAGTYLTDNTDRKVSHIARHAASSETKCQLLSKITQYYSPRSILELGTSLGISSLYLAQAAPDAHIWTIEGDLTILGMASAHRCDWADQITYINASFEQGMNQLLAQGEQMDMILIDGAHHSTLQQPLIPYYLGLSHPGTIWVVDDIYWSDDMTRWWQSLKKRRQFNVAIDLFHFGILYHDPRALEAIDVRINPKKIRWRSGLRRPRS